MALARVTYTQSVSGNRNFSVPFPYLSKDHVKVTVNGEAVTFSWLSASSIQLTTAPAIGAKVEVRRVTERNSLLVDFADGSTLTESQLDLASKQNFYLSQEADDLAVESNTIANDAKTTAQSADSKANTAISTANSATTTANNAATTANNAATSASNAVTTANTALSTANAASTEARNAVTTANTAKTEANKAVNTANSANSTANSAASQVASAVATANAAASDAATALNTANTALADSASAVSLANFASLKADSAEAAAVSASQDAQSAAADAGTAVTTAQQLEVTVNQVLADVQAIAGGDLSDFAKNSENLALLADKAAARANLGLGNVNNTSDLDKPVSTATRAAIDSGLATKANVSHTHSKAEITDLSLTWGDVTGKPTTFAPSPHTHPVGEVTGLGTAATANVTTSALDSTAGRLLKVGDFGVGNGISFTNSDMNSLTKMGFYYVGNCTNAPEIYGGVFVAGSAGEPVQLWVGLVSSKVFVRKYQSSAGWSSWLELYHTGNLNWNSLPAKPATFPPSGHTHGANDIATAFTAAGLQSLGTNGYQQFPGGLILQWGRTASIAGDSSTTITFPITFPSVVAVAHATPLVTGNAVTIDNWGMVEPISTSQLRVYRGLNGANQNNLVYWTAIGY